MDTNKLNKLDDSLQKLIICLKTAKLYINKHESSINSSDIYNLYQKIFENTGSNIPKSSNIKYRQTFHDNFSKQNKEVTYKLSSHNTQGNNYLTISKMFLNMSNFNAVNLAGTSKTFNSLKTKSFSQLARESYIGNKILGICMFVTYVAMIFAVLSVIAIMCTGHIIGFSTSSSLGLMCCLVFLGIAVFAIGLHFNFDNDMMYSHHKLTIAEFSNIINYLLRSCDTAKAKTNKNSHQTQHSRLSSNHDSKYNHNDWSHLYLAELIKSVK